MLESLTNLFANHSSIIQKICSSTIYSIIRIHILIFPRKVSDSKKISTSSLSFTNTKFLLSTSYDREKTTRILKKMLQSPIEGRSRRCNGDNIAWCAIHRADPPALLPKVFFMLFRVFLPLLRSRITDRTSHRVPATSASCRINEEVFAGHPAEKSDFDCATKSRLLPA